MSGSSHWLPCVLTVPVRGTRSPLHVVAALVLTAAVFLIPLRGETAADDTARPVFVIDRADIALSGAANLWELLSSRTTFNIFGRYGALMGTGAGVALVNGRPVSGLDFTTLPLAAVERIEILDQGPVRHSANGIGRTINIVLRDDHEGVEVSAGIGVPSRKGMDTRNASALWGGTLGRGHMTVVAAHYGRDELRARDRHFSRAKYTPGGSYADAEGISDQGNTVILPGDDGGRFALGACDTGTYTGVLTHPGGEVCGFPSGDVSWLRGEMSRESLQFTADQSLDDDSDVYAEARIAQGKTFSVWTPNSDRLEIRERDATESGTWQAFTEKVQAAVPNLPPGYVFPADGRITLLHSFVGHGNREWTTDLEEYELTLGVQGEPDEGLGYDLHVEYYKDREVETGINLQSVSQFHTAIFSGAYDFVNPLSQESEHRQAIHDMAVRSTVVTENEYMRANASLEGEALTLPSGAVRWTVGAEVEDWSYRNVFDFRDNQNRPHENDDVIGYGGASYAADRRRISVMADSVVPLLDVWDLTLGVRRDDYDDVGEAVSLHAANRFRLNDNLEFRTSWSRAARPPGVFWVHSPQAQYFVYVCDPLLEDENGDPDCDWVHVLTGGNPNLEADQIERLSVGATTTFDGFSFAVDWFSVDNIDRPAAPNFQVLVERAADGNPLPDTSVERDVAGDNSIERIIAPLGPFEESRTRGVKLHVGAEWETDWADLALDLHATRTLHRKTVVVGVESPGGYPRDRAYAVLQARRGNIAANWSVYGRSGYLNSLETGRYSTWYGHDLTVRWRDALGIGLDLTGGILNIANRDASLDSSGQRGAVTSFDSDRGRTFFLNATMTW